jgi:hypothetical protein
MEYKNNGDIIKFIRQQNYVWEKYLDEGGIGKTAEIKKTRNGFRGKKCGCRLARE